jgi:mannose-1-phosphate guanylyltransferase / mannose-6-phosphate isomerase
VILSGGSGTRLWPLSTPGRPKQFAAILDGSSLFAATLARASTIPGSVSPIVVAGRDHLAHVRAAAEQEAVDPGMVVLEPEGRNTAPAVAAAALLADPEDILLILPSDHLIVDADAFRRRAAEAAGLAGEGWVVTFGVVPTRPDTGYGYIELGEEAVGPARRLARFQEKPGREEAERMIGDGGHLWNSGMFAVAAGTLLEEMARHCPDVLDPVRESIPGRTGPTFELGEQFSSATRISFDHAVMEHTERGVVLPIDVGWDDIGSFLALYETATKDGDGNSAAGDVVLEGVTGSLVRATSRKVAVSGLSDIVVVETDDAVLVIPLERSQDVRSLVERISRS